MVATNNLSSAIKTINEHLPKLASHNINSKSRIYKIENNLSRKLSGELELIIAKSMAKNSEHRYLSAIQFADDIQNYLQNRPIIAKKDSVIYRFGKFVQRHMSGFLLGATAVISLIVLSLILYMQSKDLKQSLVEINQEQQRVLQVTNFLKDIFKISDPIITDKKIVKVKDLLDYSSKQLNTQFMEEPITRAKLYETLGHVYLNMSDLTQAELLFSKATDIYTEHKQNKALLGMHLAKTRLFQQQGKLQQAQSELNSLLQENDFTKLAAHTQAEIEVLNGQNKYKLGELHLS